MTHRLIDLFCGCGGMSLGFQNAGFKIISAYDNWDPAIEVYKVNFTHPIFKCDLSSEEVIGQIKKQRPDIIIGGPPCQDFSIAGKREFDGKRANLTLAYAKIISVVRPKWFVMENVYNIEKTQILAEAVAIFKQAGYGISRRVFDASRTGVPQQRKRYIVIGKQGVQDGFLDEILASDLSSHPMTIRDYLGDSLKTNSYYMHPRSYNRRAIFSIDEPSSTIRGVNRPIPKGYKFHPADKCKDLSMVRVLSDKERSLLQTFPETFIFTGKQTSIEQMIGNAVPVKMAEFIAKHIWNNWK